MPFWFYGAGGFFFIAIGLALAVAPGSFNPPLNDPKALLRRRILGPAAFFGVAALVESQAFSPYQPPDAGWKDFMASCLIIAWAMLVIGMWAGIVVARRERRRADHPTDAPR